MKTIVGNWKMHTGPVDQVAEWAKNLNYSPAKTEIVLAVSAPYINKVSWAVGKTDIKVGAQDLSSTQAEGAYTGDVNAVMLKEVGASYVILGHSERRVGHGESNEDVRLKAAHAMQNGLVPIICIGESQQERERGEALKVVEKQVMESLPDDAVESRFILAYEPVWAIGSGKTPTEGDIGEMHRHIQSVAAQRTGLAPEAISVLYGGSVKSGNAATIMAVPGVSGVLVGGASLKLKDEFSRIIEAAGKV